MFAPPASQAPGRQAFHCRRDGAPINKLPATSNATQGASPVLRLCYEISSLAHGGKDRRPERRNLV